MGKIKSTKVWKSFKSVLLLVFFVLFSIIVLAAYSFKKKGYSLFIEFHHTCNISVGTSVNMRGVNIGYVKDLKLGLNTVIVLVNIKSNNIFIPKKSIVETTQTGILKDAVIDIIPLEKIDFHQISNINHFSSNCYNSRILCNYHHIYGERGINYDDLIRATTRISQRFDDPRFFNLCYIMLQKLITTSSTILDFTSNFNRFILLFSSCLNKYFLKY